MASLTDAVRGADAKSILSDNAATLSSVSPRLDSIDLLRGTIMVLMALDHIRDFMTWRARPPEILALHNSLALFFTRWITHFCAPTFFFLAGTGAYLMLARRSKSEVSRFLWTRGLWLIVLEWTVSWFTWTFIPVPAANMIILTALGVSMIILSGLIYIPLPWLTALSLVVIAGHNLLDGIDASSLSGAKRVACIILHQQGALRLHPTPAFFVFYSIVPWFAVMSAGFCFVAIVKMAR